MVKNYTNIIVNVALYLKSALELACEWASPDLAVDGEGLRELVASGLVHLHAALFRWVQLSSRAPE